MKNIKKIPSHFQQLAQNRNLVSVSNETHQQNVLLQKLLVYIVGNNVEITLKNGSAFKGILESVNLEKGEYCLKYVRAVVRDGARPVANWNVLAKDVACISCIGFDPKTQSECFASVSKPKSSTGFQTDTSISKASGRAKERTLEVWSTDEPQDESLSLNYKSGENWDQFAANEKKFGVKTDFNENLYTTVLDKSAADFKKKEEQAERLAREIEKGSASNPHVAEERGQKVYDKNADEEAIYSSVAREKQADFNANLKLFDQMTSKSKNRSNVPMNVASAIRKASIDQIASGKTVAAAVSKTGPSALPAKPTATAPQTTVSPVSFDKASLAQSAEKFSAILAKQPIDDLKRKFKPFANDMKSHLTERKQSILKEGRKHVIEDFKSFSTEFKIPEFKAGESTGGSPRSTTGSIKTEPDLSTPTGPGSSSNAASIASISQVDKSPSKKVKEPTPEINTATSETGSHDTSATSTPAKSSFKLSATATEFTPTGYPPSTAPYYANKRGGNKSKTYHNKGNHMSGGYYNNAGGYYPQDPALYGGAQFYPQQQFMHPPRGYMNPGPHQMYAYPPPPMYAHPVAYAPNGAPIMNAPPYMMNGSWYPGMEHMEQPPSGEMPPKEEDGELLVEDEQQPDSEEQADVEDGSVA